MDIGATLIIASVESVLIRQWQNDGTANWGAGQTLALFVAQYTLLKYYRMVLYPKYFSPLRHFPGPSGGHLFFGQTINILRAETPVTLFNEWMQKWPEAPFIRYLGVGNSEVLLPNSPSVYKEVLQTQCYSFRKPDWFMRMLKDVIGVGLVSLDGDSHKLHRKMLNVPFAFSNIRKLEPLFQEKARGIGSVFDSAISDGDDGGATGVIECTETFSKATLDIMGVAMLGELSFYFSRTFGVFGSYFTWENNKSTRRRTILTIKPGKELSHLNTVRYTGKDTTKAGADEYSFAEAYNVFFSPGPVGKLLTYFNGFFPLRWLPLAANREYKYASWWLNDTLTKVCRERFQTVQTALSKGTYESSESRDLTTFMVEESLPGGSITNLPEEIFVGHLLQFMLAGHETSATMLSWSPLIMAKQQDIQNRLRGEVMTLVRSTPEPPYSRIDELTYLDNFIKETMRVYSPSATYHRQAAQDLIIGGHRIPKGTCIDVAPSMIMLNPLIWGRDSQQIDPDRWNHLTTEQSNPYVYGAFSNGPRICIGKAFAMMEMKIILIELVRNYRFLSVEKSYTVENPNLTLRPAGLEIRLERIKQ